MFIYITNLCIGKKQPIFHQLLVFVDLSSEIESCLVKRAASLFLVPVCYEEGRLGY